ncbi:hypothetical protein GCM10009547_45600 [Sporichthya brevicatena]|uniref:Major facilitator superfamily (MFS) profile domain-containing protein n=1 Tax=Sporichthya brevicatena TaxID=171442 RepID=A0ABN1HB05_9ACTN
MDTATQAEHGRQHHNVTLGILVLSTMAYALQQTLVAPAMPAIQEDLGVSTTAITYLLTAFLLTGSVATPVMGRLGDMFGKKRLLVIALGVFAFGSLVCALSSSIEVLIAGRAIQGIGSAVFPLAFGIIRDEFPRERVASAVGLLSATFGIGGGAGIVLSGVIVDHLDYEWIFWLGLSVILIALLAAAMFVPESPVKVSGKVDWGGAALLSGGLVALLVGVSEGNSWGWSDVRILGLFAAAAVLLVAWVGYENRHPAPLVDMRMMRRRTVLTTNLSALLLGFGMFAGFILLPKFVQAPEGAGYGFGSSVTEAGLFMLPSSVVMLFAGPVAGWMCNRFGDRVPLLLGTTLALVAYGFLTVAHSEKWMIVLAITISGLGIGFSFAATANLILGAVQPTETGVAMGMNTIMRTVGGAVGGQVGAAVLMAHTGDSGLPSETGYTVAFAVLAGGVAVALLLVLAIPRRVVAPAAVPAAVPMTEHPVATGLAAEAGVEPVRENLLGTIRTTAGAPAAGAVVTVIGRSGREVARTRVGDDGTYGLDLPGAGTYYVVAQLDGQHGSEVVQVDAAAEDGEFVRRDLVLRGASRPVAIDAGTATRPTSPFLHRNADVSSLS